jgi:hypothetical protein
MYALLALYISPVNGATDSVSAAMKYGQQRLGQKALRLGRERLRERMLDGKQRGFYCSCDVLVFESEEARAKAYELLLATSNILHKYHVRSDIDIRYRSLTIAECRQYQVASQTLHLKEPLSVEGTSLVRDM